MRTSTRQRLEPPLAMSRHRAELVFDAREIDAVLFDMDGVVTQTASLHAAAWKQLFDRFLANRNEGDDFIPFDATTEYHEFVDGRCRHDGVASFLASRDIELPNGTPQDAPTLDTVWGLANRKNILFEAAIEQLGVRLFGSTIAWLHLLRAAQIRVGLVSASEHATAMLERAGVGDLFDVIVDGLDASNMNLAGKPAPDTFLYAASCLNADPARTAVVEDAVSGVAAAACGGFGVIIGIDRGGNAQALSASGATLVAADLAVVDLTLPKSPSILVYDADSDIDEGRREALTVIGNGYGATRGTRPERIGHDGYAGTYLAGIYNRLTSDVDGREIEDESIVNVPNWLPLTIGPPGLDGWNTSVEVAHERWWLDVRHGLLVRRAVIFDAIGRRSYLIERRLWHAALPHIAAIQWTLIPDNWEGQCEIWTGLDGSVINNNVTEYQPLEKSHLRPTVMETGAGDLVLGVRTVQSGINIVTAARTRVWANGQTVQGPWRNATVGTRLSQALPVDAANGQPFCIEKIVSIYTSRDTATGGPVTAARHAVQRADDFDLLMQTHRRDWRDRWTTFGVTLDGVNGTQHAINVNTFHLLQTVSTHTSHLDAGVPARGLHGEGYRGHVFWDELFVLPLLNFRDPHLARSLLEYRYRRLDEARWAARQAGYSGAMFPWQSGSDGREETPNELFNLRSSKWMPDNSHLQRHVGLAVAYNVWQHWQTTGDLDFLLERGAELLIEIARFFVSIATLDEASGHYEINGVMGPDEFHDGYPGTGEPGLHNNTYTNVMTSWLLSRALEAVRLAADHHGGSLLARLDVSGDELRQWSLISHTLKVVFAANGRLSQFEGYEDLEELDFDHYRSAYGNIGRLDLILAAEGDSPNRYKVSKQADVLMLFYLFSDEELTNIFEHLDYHFDKKMIGPTVEYYLARTTNGSTLSRVVSAWVLSRLDRERSWQLLGEALRSDLDDTQGGTTREGIHVGAIAATLDIVQRCYTGLQLRGNVLRLNPRLPLDASLLACNVVYRDQRLQITVTRNELSVRSLPCAAEPIQMELSGQRFTVNPNDECRVPLSL